MVHDRFYVVHYRFWMGQRGCHSVAGMVDLLRWYCEKDRILEVEELWDLLDKQKPPAKAADPTGGFRSHQPIDERHCMLEPPSTPKLPHLRLGVTLG